MDTRFKAEKIVFEDQSGYMLYQYDGEKSVVSQFVREEEFEEFLHEIGINQSDIIFI